MQDDLLGREEVCCGGHQGGLDGPGHELWCYSKLPTDQVIKEYQQLVTIIASDKKP